MKIAIIGIRGIPVIYSGFEVVAEKLSIELAKKNHEMAVYCRSLHVNLSKRKHKGVELVVLPAIKGKNLETFSHSLLATLHATIFGRYDLIYYLGVGNALFSLLPRLFGIKTVVNVDGLDWRREKWGIAGKTYLALSEHMATIFPNEVITDSIFIKKYYKKRFGKKTKYIPYGYYSENRFNKSSLKRFDLKKRDYLVWVGRIVPDNHLDELVNAFMKTKTSIKCVVIGDDINKNEYRDNLLKKMKKDKRFIPVGFQGREAYASLVNNSLAYIETKRSGGTHPSLVEAMGFGSLIVSNDNSAHQEVLGNTAVYYEAGSVNNLIKKIEWATSAKNNKKKDLLRKIVVKRAKQKYSWIKIIEKYERFFAKTI